VVVFLGGRCLGIMGWEEYREQVFPRAREKIKTALAGLADRYEFIVIEGAGSPVEVNLRETDLANRYVARLADPSVFLVADIDRGGAFAALVGTLALMEQNERKRVRGLIINKFHGEMELLRPGLDFLEEYTGLPTAGVLPYLPDLLFTGEDHSKKISGKQQVDISPDELRRRLDDCLPLIDKYLKIEHFIAGYGGN
ncbi:MAG TPA: AAA family ATPase, partial [Firmicutes bacterium]|nr:AAA family ATPase [Bacillota bacterium]